VVRRRASRSPVAPPPESAPLAASPPSPAEVPAPPQEAAPLPSPVAPEASHGLGSQRAFGLVAGAIGVVGLGVGAAFGVLAMTKQSSAQNTCPNPQCPTQDGVNAWNDAGSAGNVATVGFVVGGVALAGAAVLWFTAPSSGTVTTKLSVGPGGVQVRGTW